MGILYLLLGVAAMVIVMGAVDWVVDRFNRRD